jgi:hypothetical protein
MCGRPVQQAVVAALLHRKAIVRCHADPEHGQSAGGDPEDRDAEPPPRRRDCEGNEHRRGERAEPLLQRAARGEPTARPQLQPQHRPAPHRRADHPSSRIFARDPADDEKDWRRDHEIRCGKVYPTDAANSTGCDIRDADSPYMAANQRTREPGDTRCLHAPARGARLCWTDVCERIVRHAPRKRKD